MHAQTSKHAGSPHAAAVPADRRTALLRLPADRHRGLQRRADHGRHRRQPRGIQRRRDALRGGRHRHDRDAPLAGRAARAGAGCCWRRPRCSRSARSSADSPAACPPFGLGRALMALGCASFMTAGRVLVNHIPPSPRRFTGIRFFAAGLAWGMAAGPCWRRWRWPDPAGVRPSCCCRCPRCCWRCWRPGSWTTAEASGARLWRPRNRSPCWC